MGLLQDVCLDVFADVEAALALEAEEAGLFLGHVAGEGAGGVDIADGDVTLFPQGMVGEVKLGEVLVDHPIIPVDNGVNLDHAVLHLKDAEFRAGLGLLAAQPGDPGAGAEFADGALHGFDFVELVILLNAFDAMFPLLAIPGFLPGGAEGGAVDLEVQFEPLGQFVGKAVSFGKEMTGIDQHNGDVWPDLGCQMKGDGRLRTEAGGENDLTGKTFDSPANPFFRGGFFEPGADFAETGFRWLDGGDFKLGEGTHGAIEIVDRQCGH